LIDSQQSSDFFERGFRDLAHMVILRGHSLQKTIELATGAWARGVRLVEVPVQNETAWSALEQLRSVVPDHCHIGAGTVLSESDALRAMRAGAQFTVAPGWSARVAETSLTHGLPHLPGVATASEIMQARAGGLRWMKAFPFSAFGPQWLTAMLGPFPDVSFVAVGGVAAADLEEIQRAGGRAVGLGRSFETDAKPASVEGEQ
jgi:2-dehydro-3-deoxyphosphogluconate aldolase/(4S)-4-hydroxy-2-oxoglutarate aldolase